MGNPVVDTVKRAAIMGQYAGNVRHDANECPRCGCRLMLFGSVLACHIDRWVAYCTGCDGVFVVEDGVPPKGTFEFDEDDR